jgi:type I restriction enzyme S subunit
MGCVAIAYPPLPEQRSIAAVLSKIQEAIAAQQEIIDRTRELKKALMAKLFIEGLRGEPTNETEIGPVPESWEVKSVAKCCTLIVDCPHSRPKFMEDGVRVIRNMNLKEGFIVDKPSHYVTEEDYLIRTKRATLNDGDIICSREAPVGEAGLVPSGSRLCLGQRMMQFRTVKNVLNPQFFVYCLYTESIRKRMFSLSSGATAQHINVADMKSFKIPLPNIVEQNQIVEAIYSVDSGIFAKKAKMEALQDLFKTMLHELLTGNIRTTPLMEV